MLPFTAAQFFELFRVYNDAIWPIQLVAYGIGLVAVGALARPGPAADRLISGSLALMWIWTGIAYHWSYFYAINAAALFFGLIFIFQGAYFLYAGVFQRKLSFGYTQELRPRIGGAFIVYAAIVYPLIGIGLGHAYSELPQFGVTPCPVTLFTFGWLLMLRRPIHWWLVAVPLVWSLIGGTAAVLLDVPQDWPLLAGGVITLWCMAKLQPPLLR